ncbi:putative endonuclease [Bacillus mesophilus]|uniref:GIY-YIG nuclease family protein n=1 Tax=Bacillus mesophilus TaxID=1808955 RepID=A0A6M0QCR5_9BACI|nr:GIY-YIG nuclease family protein [Bacillus mesophilus]MBM7663406.1 putative endonuclease [Bacillus mesophilus]NEY74144.1 GIY-YIG nuclease family protein [Bacillus mesophilus]
METPNHYFYVLSCKDGSFYGGYTNNLEQRIDKHNEGKGAKYTRARNPVFLLYYEIFSTKQLAMSAEYRFKQLSRKAKEKFLEERGVNYATTEKLS